LLIVFGNSLGGEAGTRSRQEGGQEGKGSTKPLNASDEGKMWCNEKGETRGRFIKKKTRSTDLKKCRNSGQTLKN